MTPKQSRKYPTEHKTTTPEGKREYMRLWMADYRKRYREMQKKLRELGITS